MFNGWIEFCKNLKLIMFESGESLKKTHLLESSSDIMNMEEGGTIFSGRTPVDYSKVEQRTIF